MHHWAWNRTLEPLGIQLDWDAYRKNFVGVADEVALDVVLRDRLHLSDNDGLVARKQSLFRQKLAEAQPFSPDTVRLLEELSRV